MKSAQVLGFQEDAKHYQELLNRISKAFENEFFDATGKIKTPYTPTQTGYLLALGFNILSEETANKSINHLVQLIKDRGTHLRTGFIGTPLLAPVLDKTGHTDLLYEILLKETYPSWFYSINQGATTMWERWDGYTHDKGFANRALSFNHYAYGAIGQWLYERIAGISPLEPGYKKVLFAPLPHQNISEAQGSYNSIYGKIESEWKFIDGNFVYNITVPPNTTAKVILPKFSNNNYVTMNGKRIEASIKNEKLTIDNIESGNYEIVYKNVK
tara:strand:+ start:41 stop:853 length:813 start_codon:yes stop_codon:yes gene_type:complete